MKKKYLLSCKFCGIEKETTKEGMTLHEKYCKSNPNREYPYFYGKKHTKEVIEKIRKAGGIREGSGNGKKGWYKGIYCDSTWELAFVIYMLDKKIDIKRNYKKFSYIYNNEQHNYIPDFYKEDTDTYYEIKGFIREKDLFKWKYFKNNLIILGSKEIIPIIKQIKKDYDVVNIEDLYEVRKKNKNYEKEYNLKQEQNRKRVLENKINKNKKIQQRIEIIKKYLPYTRGMITKITKETGLSKHVIHNTLKLLNICMIKQINNKNKKEKKFNSEQIKYIREHYVPRDKEFGARALGRKFNTGHDMILDIINNKIYKIQV